ncbi:MULTISPECIES: ATP-binding cassette domain-containing protein [Streptomyces]|uniref:ABC transporter ATP-binding protein n=1 Tax=Streptomyces venezuelae (strain ATCC 10712 / CBS 650.69 / DSM 40230 / JCM 4526 / NBRC 13096 / PD 04745) TaxID=953739 RepID=F2R8J1_STRVP|nr:ATP-binding cassette domain-containing protein [Streptomyces venezuelae]AEA03264.1 ABC transporter ATP-binding subunit [Streptomyces venezuelae ATCC 10712]APE20066.1 multidrug ABC transporter ATP-binding protein [Streptomyces venezuelae]QER97467.1 multidrug ABC transporter ATP-binding protein [Streptomyces venezuelae ATCC 10712]CCA53909.1 ABC transporter ATP-binding protein [Streptomyces venezuelae ATCC 10712]
MQPPAGDDDLAPVPLGAAADRTAVAPHVPEPGYAISTRGLVKSYPGPHGTSTLAVRGVDLDVRQGETFAFLGPNGAGKSTTIAVLCALARPTAGQATVAGADVVGRPHEVRRRVGMLFQHSALDGDLTAEQNLFIHARLYGLSRRRARSRTAEVLGTAGLTDRRRSPVRTLSGGMRRRLEIARALLHSPRVLFLDEPTTGLDPHARAQVWDQLRALRDRDGSTLFVTTHYLDEAENCDRIAIIDRGRVVARGTPRALKAAIGDDRVVLRTGDDAVAGRIVCGLVPPDRAVTVDTGGVSLRLPEGSTWIPRLCAALQRHGVAVHAASAAPPTLDDVFFHHTGRSLDAPGTGRPPAGPTPPSVAAPSVSAPDAGGER